MKRRHFQITTAQGHRAMINGDSNMSPQTRRSLGELLDAAVRAVTITPRKASKREQSKPTRRRYVGDSLRVSKK